MSQPKGDSSPATEQRPIKCGCGADCVPGTAWCFVCNPDYPAEARAAGMAAPSGWKLVPLEPTKEMKEAGGRYKNETGIQRTVGGYWRAMIAASPAALSETVTMQLLLEAHRFLNAQAYTQEEMEDFCARLNTFLRIPNDR